MGKVIHLPTRNPIPPKSETYEHAGQRYTCTYDPVGKQWVWLVNYVSTYRYFGTNPTLESAAVAARKKIHTLNKRVLAWEENSD